MGWVPLGVDRELVKQDHDKSPVSSALPVCFSFLSSVSTGYVSPCQIPDHKSP